MKIVNKTGWDTKPLREIARRVAAERLDSDQRKRLVVTFESGRHNSGASGRCLLDRLDSVRILLPAVRGHNLNNLRSVAMVIAHEIMHGLGYEHRDLAFGGEWLNDHYSAHYDWTDSMIVMPCPAAIKPPKPTDADKLARAEAIVKRWQSRIKRDTTHLKKWQRKVKYYQKKVAVTGTASKKEIND